MRIEKVTYEDGVVFARLLDSFGRTIAEARGKWTLKQMMKKINGGI